MLLAQDELVHHLADVVRFRNGVHFVTQFRKLRRILVGSHTLENFVAQRVAVDVIDALAVQRDARKRNGGIPLHELLHGQVFVYRHQHRARRHDRFHGDHVQMQQVADDPVLTLDERAFLQTDLREHFSSMRVTVGSLVPRPQQAGHDF